MQPNVSSKGFLVVIAFVLTTIIAHFFSPYLGLEPKSQIDFILLIIISMVLLSLPFTLLEVALAYRSKQTPLLGFSQLTRDADASTKWRLIGWLSILVLPILAGGLLLQATQALVVLASTFDGSNAILYPLAAVLAVIISFAPQRITLMLAAIGLILMLIISGMQNDATWQWTSFSGGEWAAAVILSLLATGLGLGIYWQNALSIEGRSAEASSLALPVWFAQLAALIGFVALTPNDQLLSQILYFVVIVLVAAALIRFALNQLKDRQQAIVLQWLIIVGALVLWAIPQAVPYLVNIIFISGLVIALSFAIFSGWVMKISHLRKALNFKSEAIYNVWRILIRIIAPLAIIVALFFLVLSWF